MQVLIVNGSWIFSNQPFQESNTAFIYDNLIVPKNSLEQYQVVEATLPADWKPNKYYWSNNAVVANNSWVDPDIVVPTTVSPYQARVALAQANLLSSVETMISSANQQVQLAWNYATVFERDSPFINALGTNMGLSNSQIDTLFINAAKVTA